MQLALAHALRVVPLGALLALLVIAGQVAGLLAAAVALQVGRLAPLVAALQQVGQLAGLLVRLGLAHRVGLLARLQAPALAGQRVHVLLQVAWLLARLLSLPLAGLQALLPVGQPAGLRARAPSGLVAEPCARH